MRIGIEAQRIFRNKKHGMDIYALQLIKHLMEIDKENEYFIFVKPGPDECLRSTNNFHIIKVHGITYLDWEQVSLPWYAARYQLDLLHCTSNTAPLLTSIPLILTLHDIIYLNKGFQGGSWYQRLGHYYRRWVVPMVYHKAKKIITVSDFEKQAIEERMGKDERLLVIYNGVHEKFNADIPVTELIEVRKKYNLPHKYLFFLGNTAPKKNMRNMLVAYARYTATQTKALPLVIAESSQEVINALLQELSLAHISHKIHLTGYVGHDDLPAIYAMADTFVYPSLRESFGIPIIESMACGTAVITSNTSSMPEVSGGASCLIEPEDIEDIADAISLLTHFQEKRKQLEDLGIARSKTFTWFNTAAHTKSTYTRSIEYAACL
jgi:glycosyltransferase involved in cell wall biosynthesis